MNVILKTARFTILLNTRDVRKTRRDVGPLLTVEPRYQYILKTTNSPDWLETAESNVLSDAFAEIMSKYTAHAEAEAEREGFAQAVRALRARESQAQLDGHETVAMALAGSIVVVKRAYLERFPGADVGTLGASL